MFFSCFLSLFYSENVVEELLGGILLGKLFKTFVVSKDHCYGKLIGKFLFEFFYFALKIYEKFALKQSAAAATF